jgi:hypothetical protein
MMLYKLLVKLRRQYGLKQESFDHYTVTSSEETAMITKAPALLLKERHIFGVSSCPRSMIGRDLKL